MSLLVMIFAIWLTDFERVIMREFARDFLFIGIKYTIALAIAFPLIWLIRWEAPSIDDILNWQVFRLVIGLWIISAIGAWWINHVQE